jgi:hypothetical protein
LKTHLSYYENSENAYIPKSFIFWLPDELVCIQYQGSFALQTVLTDIVLSMAARIHLLARF